MLLMPGVPGVASARILSAGATFVFGAGLALYLLTSLVLGPANSRQLYVSLTIPAVDMQGASPSLATNVPTVVGSRAITSVATPSMRAWVSPRAVSIPTSREPQPLPSAFPVAGANQHPAAPSKRKQLHRND